MTLLSTPTCIATTDERGVSRSKAAGRHLQGLLLEQGWGQRHHAPAHPDQRGGEAGATNNLATMCPSRKTRCSPAARSSWARRAATSASPSSRPAPTTSPPPPTPAAGCSRTRPRARFAPPRLAAGFAGDHHRHQPRGRRRHLGGRLILEPESASAPPGSITGSVLVVGHEDNGGVTGEGHLGDVAGGARERHHRRRWHLRAARLSSDLYFVTLGAGGLPVGARAEPRGGRRRQPRASTRW